ncbi:hypothetical protein [Dactylosporangium sp. NPDC005555]|uniref:hypothetical protein n=1 Tax=Dactylosporangium sp. NPDC005555 TaxID=3154889 RepID=UPI00339F5EA2
MWRVADPDRLDHPRTGISGGTARLASMLVATFATVGDTIVMVGDDPHLAGVAGAAGCRFHQVGRLADLAGLDHLGNRVGILVTTWPQPPPGRLPGDAEILFAACEDLVARHGSTIVTLPIRPSEDSYGTHGWRLLTEAEEAGFRLHAHIVVVDLTVPDDDSSGLNPAPDTAGTNLNPYRHVLIFAPPGRDPHARPRNAGQRPTRSRRRTGARHRPI